MNLQARRERDNEAERDRALLQMRETVISAMPQLASLGSAPVAEAVDEALEQMRAAGKHLAGKPQDAKRLWIFCARRRLIDRHRSAETRHRERAPVDEHTQALALGGVANLDLGDLSEDDPDWWRTLEILDVLPGDQGLWGKAWFAQLDAGHTQPRGLAEELGWSRSYTEKVAQRAKAKMEAFLSRRAAGSVCDARQAVLDSFILTSAGRTEEAGVHKLSDERFRAVLIHLMGCTDCRTAWKTRRPNLLARYSAILVFPLNHVAAALAALREKLRGLGSHAERATLSLYQRLGIGGGASATAAGGGVATFGTKAAALCGAAVCAVGGGTAAVVTEIPSLLTPPVKAHHQAQHHAAKAASALR